jgi:hypothetical protein
MVLSVRRREKPGARSSKRYRLRLQRSYWWRQLHRLVSSHPRNTEPLLKPDCRLASSVRLSRDTRKLPTLRMRLLTVR